MGGIAKEHPCERLWWPPSCAAFLSLVRSTIRLRRSIPTAVQVRAEVSAAQLMLVADHALYAAKNSGGNCVVQREYQSEE